MRIVPLSFILLAAIVNAANAQEAADTATLPAVVISATRVEQSSFDLPLSIDRIERSAIQDGQAKINLSESLQRVPGLVAQNRQNYAQDLQISSRGFGARSTFGIRGVRLYVDGIPATLPDGQGQVSHVDLGSAARIEVLRGPFSALYGNSSGGVISVFTEDGAPGTTLTADTEAGSYGSYRHALKAAGQQGTLNYVISAAHFTTDGYREHSAATRANQNAKLRLTLNPHSSLTLIANAVDLRDVQDPLGLSRAQFMANPRGVDSSALQFNTRKAVDQQQLGLRYELDASASDHAELLLYGGQRQTLQFQAIAPSAQLAATSAGAVIDLGRDYGGIDLRWTHKTTLAGAPLRWTIGASYDNLAEQRRGYENFSGSLAAPVLGVRGRLRRDETNRVFNLDQYLQAEWQPTARWLLLAGVRNSRVQVRSTDHYLAAGNGDDSGVTSYRAFTPVLGATFKLHPAINLYASYGRGFETPTLNELSYRSTSGSSTGLNFGLQPARSTNLEAGIKALIGAHWQGNLALFRITTRDELAVLSNSGGRAVYQNVGATRRHGVEASFEGKWPNGIGALLALSVLRAEYADGFCTINCALGNLIAAGNRIPGVPNKTLYGELSWNIASLGLSTALEARYVGRVFSDDQNSDAAAGYAVANLRLGFEQRRGGWKIREFLRVDNLADRRYAGSVIVNEGRQRFFEPAPGRSFLIGLSASYGW